MNGNDTHNPPRYEDKESDAQLKLTDDLIQKPQFTEVTSYYDPLMEGVPYHDWVQYIRKLILKYEGAVHTVLDLACGTGNVSEILYEEGFDVQGVDISPGMIAVARNKAKSKDYAITYHVQDASELELERRDFDLCVSLFDSLNYILEPHRLHNSTRLVFDHLRNGGLFIFDMNSLYALESGFFDQESLYEEDAVRYVWRSEYDPDTRLCHIHMRFFVTENGKEREFRETHTQYAYCEKEVREMLVNSGFRDIHTFHRYTFKPVHSLTDRIFYACRKP